MRSNSSNHNTIGNSHSSADYNDTSSTRNKNKNSSSSNNNSSANNIQNNTDNNGCSISSGHFDEFPSLLLTLNPGSSSVLTRGSRRAARTYLLLIVEFIKRGGAYGIHACRILRVF